MRSVPFALAHEFRRAPGCVPGGSMKAVIAAAAAFLFLSVPKGVVAQSCRAVNHAQLEALLPVVPGFSRGKPVGETDTQTAVSRTTVDYEQQTPAAGISVDLMDPCGNVNMLSQFRQNLKNPPPAT